MFFGYPRALPSPAALVSLCLNFWDPFCFAREQFMMAYSFVEGELLKI